MMYINQLGWGRMGPESIQTIRPGEGALSLPGHEAFLPCILACGGGRCQGLARPNKPEQDSKRERASLPLSAASPSPFAQPFLTPTPNFQPWVGIPSGVSQQSSLKWQRESSL